MNWNSWSAHPDDRRFVDNILNRAPKPFWKYIRRFYNQKHKAGGRFLANQSMLELETLFKSASFRLASDDVDIRDRAENEVKACKRIIRTSLDDQHALTRLTLYANRYDISPPTARTTKGALARYQCPKWWRRKLRILHGQTVEKIALKLNIVNKYKDIYVSDTAVYRRRSQKARNRAILEALEAVNELGDSFTLQELADKSVSNPRLRRAELMTRIAGNEKIADELGHVGEFYTLTCPSRMHACYSKSGQPNPKYDGTTPKEAQAYLTKIWSHIRAELSNKGIQVYGMRVAEPHHDGTPHWHFLLFMSKHNKEIVKSIFRKHALKVDGDESGAEKYRFKAIPIDKNKGTAAGYVAKYISKNIDGANIDADEYGNDAKTSSERVEAYVSTWGIRQFQFFGNPPVTVWRELRRIKTSDKEKLHDAAQAADSGDWAEFIRLMGGPCARKDIMPISIMRLWSDKPGNYDEPIGYRIIGVEFSEGYKISRIHVWDVRFLNRSGEGTSPPWSSVNNCTKILGEQY